ncbi:MAG: hypothetical protein INR69_17900 [Mucilaginibacter polytrichastri]|nr:hypothetical protein [Mucilaginibacter polytrichastri]
MPADGGMLYTETDLNHLFPEPLNTLTSCFFLAIALYWTFILWGKFRQHTFLSFCLMLLYTGGIGGTIYHGLRRWRMFIYMDWMPIMFLCLLAGIYFMLRLVKWYFAVAIVALYVAFQFFARSWFSGSDFQLFININYAVMASIVLLPVLCFLYKNSWQHGRWVGFALLAFCIALFFRVADKWELLASGTHFLWHTFGAVAAFCMFRFIYLVNEKPQIRPSAADR